MNNNLNAELIEKARQAKSPEELLALAKENEITLSEEEAKAYFEQMNKTGELSDDELDNVAGGGCHAKDGRLVVTKQFHKCEAWICKACGCPVSETDKVYHHCPLLGLKVVNCESCKYMSHEGGLYLCNNPANRG